MYTSTLLFGELHFSMTFSPKPVFNFKHIIIIARIANLAEFQSSRQSLQFTWYFKKAADRGKITNKRRPRINVAPISKEWGVYSRINAKKLEHNLVIYIRFYLSSAN